MKYWLPLLVLSTAVIIGLQARAPQNYRELTQRPIQADLVASEPRFRDRTISAGLLAPHVDRAERIEGLHHTLGGGVCVLDYDRDGWEDIFLVTGAGPSHYFERPQWWQRNHHNRLYRNLGDWTFAEVSDEMGVAARTAGMGCHVFDLDADGWSDLLLLNRGENHLYRNTGNGFERLSLPPNTTANGQPWHTDAASQDLNGDGWPDLYITRFIDYQPNAPTFESISGQQNHEVNFRPEDFDSQPNLLLLSQGPGHYIDATQHYAVADRAGRGMAVRWRDLNADQRPDLLLGNARGSANQVYLATTAGPMREAGTTLGLAGRGGSFKWLDTHQSGLLSLLELRDANSPLLALQRADGTAEQFWHDRTSDYGLDQVGTEGLQARSGVVTDFNGDSWADLLLLHGRATPDADAHSLSQGQPNRLLLGHAGGWRRGCSRTCGDLERDALSSREAVAADFDRDGDLDIVIAQNNDLPQLLENLSSSAKQPPPSGSRIRMQEPASRLQIAQWMHTAGLDGLAELRALYPQAPTAVRIGIVGLAAQMNDSQGLDLLIGALDDPAAQVRVATMRALQHREYEFSTRWLLRALEDESASVRCASAAAFEHFFREEEALSISKWLAVGPLIRRLQDSDAAVRHCAAQALAEAEHYRSTAPLAQAQQSEFDARTRAAMLRALGYSRETRLRAVLQRALLETSSSAEVRFAALEALERLSEPDLVPWLLRATQAAASEGQLADWLDRLQPPHQAPSAVLNPGLVRAGLQRWWQTQAGDQQARWQADLNSEHIARLTGQEVAPSLTPGVQRLLQRMNAADESPSDRRLAARSLRLHHAAQSWRRGCQQALEQADELGRELALTELGACLEPNSALTRMPPWLQWGLDHPRLALQLAAVAALDDRLESWARDSLLKLAADKERSPRLRAEILRRFVARPLPSRSQLARELLGGNETVFWEEAAALLLASGDARDRQHLIRLVQDPTKPEAARLRIARALYQTNPREAVALLVHQPADSGA